MKLLNTLLCHVWRFSSPSNCDFIQKTELLFCLCSLNEFISFSFLTCQFMCSRGQSWTSLHLQYVNEMEDRKGDRGGENKGTTCFNQTSQIHLVSAHSVSLH